MRTKNLFLMTALLTVLALLLASCAPAAPTTAPTHAPTTVPTVPVTPTLAATATPKPAAGVSPSDLAAKAKGITEYSFDFKVTAVGMTMTGKNYVKGDKLRQETTVAGMKAVTLVDFSKKTAYTVMTEQKMAVKVDFSQEASAERPGERVAALPSDAKLVGTETIGGKSAAVFQFSSGEGPVKLWIWTERGVPLKVETTSAGREAVMEFSNYEFGPLADSLFELPAGVQVVDVPAAIPGMPGGPPAPGR